jgi:asparagine synthase (glutamine-hydrolysing)
MASALEAEDRFRRDFHHEEGLGLGRISLGILNPATQPLWNEDRSICLFMEGEVFDSDPLRQDLIERGHAFHQNSDAELALRLYEEYGREFVTRLNGAFLIAIWDRRERALVVVNDRLGLYPLYYALHSGGLAFASGVRALLADPGLPRRIDRTAIAEFLTYDHALGQRTLLSDVTLLPQGSILTFRRKRLDIQQYWRPRFPKTHPVLREADYREQVIDLLRLAARRFDRPGPPRALLLSGGLDSRVLLAVLAQDGRSGPLKTFTWGIPGCDDARFARQASRVAGVRNEFFELRPDWLLRLGEKAVRITDGLGNIVNLHALATLEEESQLAQVIVKGFMGDALFGYGLRPRYWADYDAASQLLVHLEAYRDLNVLSFDLPEHPRLFTDEFRHEVGTGLLDDYQAAMRASESSQLADQRNYISLTQRVPRMTVNGVEVVRHRAAVRLPFSDPDLVEFALGIPPGYLIGRDIMVQAFVREFPDLAQVPFTPSGLPLMSCARDVAIRARQLAQWHMRRAGLGRLAGPSSRPTKEYGKWFRTILRPWVEDILLAPAALGRGYFNPDYLRQLVRDHMAGADHAVRIGALISIELWHRQYLD